MDKQFVKIRRLSLKDLKAKVIDVPPPDGSKSSIVAISNVLGGEEIRLYKHEAHSLWKWLGRALGKSDNA